jgi:hypothetical protein
VAEIDVGCEELKWFTRGLHIALSSLFEFAKVMCKVCDPTTMLDLYADVARRFLVEEFGKPGAEVKGSDNYRFYYSCRDYNGAHQVYIEILVDELNGLVTHYSDEGVIRLEDLRKKAVGRKSVEKGAGSAQP